MKKDTSLGAILLLNDDVFDDGTICLKNTYYQTLFFMYTGRHTSLMESCSRGAANTLPYKSHVPMVAIFLLPYKPDHDSVALR